ncbi:hypothetical protein IFR05_006306 [Cadophora sp. M221]|nr:hypothetical protein IFR05_006306 [Cadophora sp. M221]
MAPATITEDYYMVLEVEQTAAPELIIRSYKRLALKLHPDRNARHDATEAFQLQTSKLGRAYATLKDESKRRDYDFIYPSITRSRPSPQPTQTPRPPPASTSQSEGLSEAAQIAALQKSKQERGARWWTKKNALDSSIFELQRDIRRLEQEIKNLDGIVAAEAAQEAWKNSWGSWLLSPIYKKAEDSGEETARKDRERQERKIEKDMKERRLGLKEADLKGAEEVLRKAKEEIDAADLVENGKIRVIQDRIRARETWERQERERAERERIAKIWKQQQEQREKREREAAEAFRKQQAEERAAEQKRQEEFVRNWQKIIDDEARKSREQYAHLNRPEYLFTAEGSTRQASTLTCQHNGWWPKVQGRTVCPDCSVIWTYLLKCPGCGMKACPKCQAAIRQRRNAARTNRRAPSPDFFYDDY